MTTLSCRKKKASHRYGSSTKTKHQFVHACHKREEHREHYNGPLIPIGVQIFHKHFALKACDTRKRSFKELQDMWGRLPHPIRTMPAGPFVQCMRIKEHGSCKLVLFSSTAQQPVTTSTHTKLMFYVTAKNYTIKCHVKKAMLSHKENPL